MLIIIIIIIIIGSSCNNKEEEEEDKVCAIGHQFMADELGALCCDDNFSGYMHA